MNIRLANISTWFCSSCTTLQTSTNFSEKTRMNGCKTFRGTYGLSPVPPPKGKGGGVKGFGHGKAFKQQHQREKHEESHIKPDSLVGPQNLTKAQIKQFQPFLISAYFMYTWGESRRLRQTNLHIDTVSSHSLQFRSKPRWSISRGNIAAFFGKTKLLSRFTLHWYCLGTQVNSSLAGKSHFMATCV